MTSGWEGVLMGVDERMLSVGSEVWNQIQKSDMSDRMS